RSGHVPPLPVPRPGSRAAGPPQGPAATFFAVGKFRNLVEHVTTDRSLLPRNNPSSSETENFYGLVVGQLKRCASVNPHRELFSISRNHVRRALRLALAN